MEILPRYLKNKVTIKHKLNCLTCFTGGKLAKSIIRFYLRVYMTHIRSMTDTKTIKRKYNRHER